MNNRFLWTITLATDTRIVAENGASTFDGTPENFLAMFVPADESGSGNVTIASSTQTGLLLNTDWVAFNSKGGLNSITANGTAAGLTLTSDGRNVSLGGTFTGVLSVNNQTGSVNLTSADISDSASRRFTNDTQLNAVTDLTTITVDSKEPTGFVNPAAIDVSWNKVARTVTLTGDLSYYFHGVKNPVTLTSPWTSSAHAAGNGDFFLISADGVTFTWSSTPFNFIDVFVAYINVKPSSQFGIRECHGLLSAIVHKAEHHSKGTWKESGGALTNGTYTEGVGTLAAVTFGVNELTVLDEDLPSVIAAWPQGTYTLMHVGAGGLCVFTKDSPVPFITATAAFFQINTPSNGLLTPVTNGRYGNIYLVAIPVTSDADSQQFRIICVQPQVSYTSLATAQAENPSTLDFGDFLTLVTEAVIITRITLKAVTAYTNDGKCHIEPGGVKYLTSSRSAITNIPAQTAASTPATPSGSFTSLTVQGLLDELSQMVLPVGSILPFAGDAPAGFLPCDNALKNIATYPSLYAYLVTSRGFTAKAVTCTIATPSVFTKTLHMFTGGERITLTTTGALPTGLSTLIDYYVVYVSANTFSVSVLFGGTAVATSGSQSGIHSYTQSLYGLGDMSTTFRASPDLRGQVLRGLDTGAGVDVGRALGTPQEDQFKSHTHKVYNDGGNINGAGSISVAVTISPSIYGFSANGDSSATGGTETRGKNVAINYGIKY